MLRKQALEKISALALLLFVIPIGCSIPRNKLHLYQRSIVVANTQDEQEILARASLELIGPENQMRVLRLRGTSYEMGFQHGVILKKEVNKFYNTIISRATRFMAEDMLDEVYDLMDPYIPTEEKEEMRGLAHGAGVPLRVVHWVHAIPEISEYGPKKRLTKFFEGTSCSNIAALGKATADGKLYHLRVLDWIREMGAQRSPIIMISEPKSGNASATFTYAGFIGAVSGLNDKYMSFGEMGYGNPPGETFEGIPFIFLFRKLMRESNSLGDALRIIQESPRTCSYIYMITDAKNAEPSKKAALILADRTRVKTFTENTDLEDERDKDKYPAIQNVVYGGAKNQALYEELIKNWGRITPEALMEMTKIISLKSNLQNVIFSPETLEVWISNASMAAGEEGRACNQQWTYYNIGRIFKNSL